MTSAQVVETSVTNNSSFQNYSHPDDHTIRTTDQYIIKQTGDENKDSHQYRNSVTNVYGIGLVKKASSSCRESANTFNMPMHGYEFYLQVFNSVSSWTREDKIHIHRWACNILFFM